LKIALISDIHSNQEALDTALQEISNREVDQIYCLGDIVGYGADPNACVDRIQSGAVRCIAGNHDSAAVGTTSIQYFNSYAQAAIRWTSAQLTETNRSYLEGLSLSFSENGIFCVHSTPTNPEKWNYIFSKEEAARHFEAFKESFCFIGHSHIPAEFASRNGKQRIINIGSIGQPRDRDPRLSFIIYDSKRKAFERVRLEYDIEKAAAKIRAAGLPEFLAERLTWGI
jgi:diadenosine tetraphosphatase ApaH/serine/threonine PP2A family protein phosphatase